MNNFVVFFLILQPLNLQKVPPKGDAANKDKHKNTMRDLRIRKLCLNICVGESGDRLTRAAKVSFNQLPLEGF